MEIRNCPLMTILRLRGIWQVSASPGTNVAGTLKLTGDQVSLISGGQITVDSKLSLVLATESLWLQGVENELVIAGSVTLGGS